VVGDAKYAATDAAMENISARDAAMAMENIGGGKYIEDVVGGGKYMAMAVGAAMRMEASATENMRWCGCRWKYRRARWMWWKIYRSTGAGGKYRG